MSLAFRHLTQATLDELGLSMLHAEVNNRRPILCTECGYQVLTFPFSPPTTKESEFGAKLAGTFIHKYIDLIRKWLAVYQSYKKYSYGTPPLGLEHSASQPRELYVRTTNGSGYKKYSIFSEESGLLVTTNRITIDEFRELHKLIDENRDVLLTFFNNASKRTDLLKELQTIQSEFGKCNV